MGGNMCLYGGVSQGKFLGGRGGGISFYGLMNDYQTYCWKEQVDNGWLLFNRSISINIHAIVGVFDLGSIFILAISLSLRQAETPPVSRTTISLHSTTLNSHLLPSKLPILMLHPQTATHPSKAPPRPCPCPHQAINLPFLVGMIEYFSDKIYFRFAQYSNQKRIGKTPIRPKMQMKAPPFSTTTSPQLSLPAPLGRFGCRFAEGLFGRLKRGAYNWDYNKISTQEMFRREKSETIPASFSSKTILIKHHPTLRQSIRNYFLQTYAVYEKLFDLLKADAAYYMRAQPLRHPLIFYFGHTATLYVNKLLDHGTIKSRINPEYEKMFAVGVDEMDWDDLNESHYDWPTVQETREFRAKVKQMVLDVIDSSREDRIDSWLSDMWVVLLGIEHERIHLETSAVIMRRVPLEYIQPVPEFPDCEYQEKEISNIPANRMEEVPAWKGVWERKKEDAETYGWDNQFGVKQFDVPAFRASQMLVSNGEYLQFVQEGGYQNPSWWTNEGQRWLSSIKPTMPLFWRKEAGEYKLRTLANIIPMPWDWPVQVNNLEARAFCKWKSQKTNTYIRLPTEDEYYSIRQSLQQDQPTWQYQSVGNINMEYWMSPNPVNLFKSGNFYDVVGNVWQHTVTPIYPFQGFQIHPVYEDFTTPTFDERHDLIKGGSFISTGNEALYHARYAFRRHFHQFAGFRYVTDVPEIEVDLHQEQVISDNNVEMNLKHHYLNPESYVVELAEQIKGKVGNKGKDARALTVGCSVGRVPLELGKSFKQSWGIDYTTRYFQMSTRLREKKVLKFKDIDISLDALNIQAEKAELFQMNPENPDEKKINECDWIIIDGLSIKKHALPDVLRKILKLAKRTAHIAVLNVSGYNELGREEAKNIMAKSVNGQVLVGDEVILKASSGDQSYLPILREQLQFRLNYYSIIEP